ncbi:hypothetical protein Mkiyose1665_35480 [Mycobacterium kiyosense]|uniref:Uncharacterized protein n=2 Tax=Mycobacterium TaxID=1763 RepID=A0A9P3Q3Z9_9MYCO|nr:hypothetical protein AO501_30065 [Mycobacterium gordonae]BDB41445.1 hypothetical protein IWGMT90018_18910 [Mycobacterium kiyosense]GLB86163.1 hypothetical protein SRL2020028_54190 [Mycobacterium kiyosense]GLB97823.1 hypothetical protein SRL2020226_45990 [Mycobacterium kiyosense]GLC18715.1 hypothetical protein SRL2020472_12860 [Mycobacterium kiyosense]
MTLLRDDADRNTTDGVRWSERCYHKRFTVGSRNAWHEVAVAFGILKVGVAVVDSAGDKTQLTRAACAAFT